MSKLPFMPLFCDAYLVDTAMLTLEAQGAYMRLLAHMWLGGGAIDDDDQRIARMLGVHVNKWVNIRKTLEGFFEKPTPGLLSQKRLQREYQKVEAKSDANRQNALTRWEGNSPKNNNSGYANASGSHKRTRSQGNAKGYANPMPGGYETHPNLNLNINIKNSIGDGVFCGKPTLALPAGTDQLNAFVNALVDLFTRLKLQPPQDYEVVRGWLQVAPDPVRCILPVIQGMLVFMVSKNLPPPVTWQYFDQAVLSSIQKQGG
jgi:uncharacterized protein YdaU (DUF1376 family)